MNGEKLRIFAPGRRGKTYLLISLTISALILFPSAIKDGCTLFFGGAIIAFFLSPIARLFEKKFSLQKSAVLSLILTIFALAILLALAFPFLFRQFALLAHRLPEIISSVKESLNGLLSKIGVHSLGFTASSGDSSALRGDFSSIARNAMDYAGNIADKIYRFALMCVLGCFLLGDRKRILLRAELLLPCAQRRTFIRHANMLLSELKMYIRGQATIALCVGGIAALTLMLIRVPGGIVLGAVVGILNVIPYFGPILGGIPAVLMALGEGWQKALLTVVGLMLVQQIDGMVISPRIMGNATGFSPASVLIALYVASKLCGIVGLLFAMPMLMAIRTLYRVFVQRYEKN